jgi:hypothetical protein
MPRTNKPSFFFPPDVWCSIANVSYEIRHRGLVRRVLSEFIDCQTNEWSHHFERVNYLGELPERFVREADARLYDFFPERVRINYGDNHVFTTTWLMNNRVYAGNMFYFSVDDEDFHDIFFGVFDDNNICNTGWSLSAWRTSDFISVDTKIGDTWNRMF